MARSVADAVSALLTGAADCAAVCEKLSRLSGLYDGAGAALAHARVLSTPRPADAAGD